MSLHYPVTATTTQHTDGNNRLSSPHNSLRSFYSGVPVSKSRLRHGNYRISRASLVYCSFTRCASSTTRYCHWIWDGKRGHHHVQHTTKSTIQNYSGTIQPQKLFVCGYQRSNSGHRFKDVIDYAGIRWWLAVMRYVGAHWSLHSIVVYERPETDSCISQRVGLEVFFCGGTGWRLLTC